jgi:hypothetical protein
LTRGRDSLPEGDDGAKLVPGEEEVEVVLAEEVVAGDVASDFTL